jgi:hypothetical protein
VRRRDAANRESLRIREESKQRLGESGESATRATAAFALFETPDFD